MQKKTLNILLVVFGVFLLPAFAYSAPLSDQPQRGTLVNANSDSNMLWYFATTTQAQVINSITMYLGSATSTVSTVSLRVTCFANNYTTSQAGCSPATGISSTNTVDIVVGQGTYDFYFATSTLSLQSGKAYAVEVYNSAGAEMYGKAIMAFPNQCQYAGGGTADCIGEPFYLLNSSFVLLDAESATSSSLFSGQDATTTLQQLAEQCSQAGNIFAEGLCIAGSFLFVPSPSTVGQFSELPSLIGERFPFSFITSAVDTWEDLTASTTSNSPTYTINLHDLGIGSTTALGNILPNVTAFSSSTVMTYFPQGLFDALKALAGFAILLALVADIFFTSRNLMH